MEDLLGFDAAFQALNKYESNERSSDIEDSDYLDSDDDDDELGWDATFSALNTFNDSSSESDESISIEGLEDDDIQPDSEDIAGFTKSHARPATVSEFSKCISFGCANSIFRHYSRNSIIPPTRCPRLLISIPVENPIVGHSISRMAHQSRATRNLRLRQF